MKDIGAYGLSAYLLASKTMPIGFLLNQFADDADSIAIEEAQNGEAVLDLNGKVISWTVANPVVVSLSVIPEGIDDDLLAVIFNANRVSNTTTPAADMINLVVRYPSGAIRTFTNGRIINGPGGPTATASGRFNGNTYTFAFGDQYTMNVASALNAVLSRVDVTGLASDFLGF